MTAAQEVGGTAIIGFGSTEVTRHPTHAIGWYAVRAVKAALESAGLDKSDLDGYVGSPWLASYASQHWDGADEVSAEYMLSALNMKPRWSADTSGLVLGMVSAGAGRPPVGNVPVRRWDPCVVLQIRNSIFRSAVSKLWRIGSVHDALWVWSGRRSARAMALTIQQ